ncbi:signal peptidase (plasmid) [Pedobacter sp. BS3]|uniref:signal peptidase n=1 Tax=Pedobacter sp. BS3 TaxID=2567937 RepID=UPI0011EF3941|nr:signal peptidase [Pedobacter sp. BS3]TZF85803.1 signal peptidase [Pedobacter sp. BS3]
MINKYTKRGILLIISGILLYYVGVYIRNNELGLYGWAMIIGVLLVGVGLLYVFYRILRRFERRAILEERAEEQEPAGESAEQQS